MNKKTAFVIMPFDDLELDMIYTYLVAPVLSEAGFTPQRADEIDPTEQIITRIVHAIEDFDLVLCELTKLSPNVMYELGIAHSLTQRVIMICKEGQKLPFDTKSFEVLFYNSKPKNLLAPSDPHRSNPLYRRPRLLEDRIKKLLLDDNKPFIERFTIAISRASSALLKNPVQSYSKMLTELMEVSVNFQRPANVPTAVLNHIGTIVKSARTRGTEPYVIAITGASCLGKTRFAEDLARRLRETEQIEASVVTLDGYMLPREELDRRGLAGPCEEAHDIAKLKAQLVTLIVNKKDINIPEFNHATGSIELMSRAVKYAPVVILEGVTAFSDSIKDLTHLRVFLEGKDPWVTKALRFLVCLEQRNRSINKSRWSAEKEYSSYSNFLAEKKKSANIVVKVEKNWSMQIDTDWDGTFSL